MAFSNALPRGEIQGNVAVIEYRRQGLDGHSSVVEATIAHTRHSLIAQAKLCLRLAEEMERVESEVIELKRHG